MVRIFESIKYVFYFCETFFIFFLCFLSIGTFVTLINIKLTFYVEVTDNFTVDGKLRNITSLFFEKAVNYTYVEMLRNTEVVFLPAGTIEH